MRHLVANSLIGAHFFTPALKQETSITVIMQLSSLGCTFNMLNYTVMDNIVSQIHFAHPKAKVDVFTSVDKDLVEPTELIEGFSTTDATSCGDGAPLPNTTLEGTMEISLAIVSGDTLRGKNNPHVIITPIAN